jgi:hypothetical protein
VKIIRGDGEGQEIEVHVNPQCHTTMDMNHIRKVMRIFYQFIIVQKRTALRY